AAPRRELAYWRVASDTSRSAHLARDLRVRSRCKVRGTRYRSPPLAQLHRLRSNKARRGPNAVHRDGSEPGCHEDIRPVASPTCSSPRPASSSRYIAAGRWSGGGGAQLNPPPKTADPNKNPSTPTNPNPPPPSLPPSRHPIP